MEVRPKISIKPTKTDLLLESLSWFIVACTIFYLAIQFNKLPERIPVHFNFQGVADRYGDRSSIFIIIAVPVLFNIVLSVLGKYPHRFNYLSKITEENAEFQYRKSIQLLRMLKISIALIFALISYEMIHTSGNNAMSDRGPVLLIILPVIMIPLIWYVYSSSSSR